MKLIISIIILLLMMLIHEIGHFLAAMKVGIQVDEFSIGIGSKIYQKFKGNTKYTFRLFPVGGYVAFDDEEVEEPYNTKAFRNAKASKRLAVILAGALMNFILGFLILTVVNSVSIPKVNSIIKNSPAERAGLKVGDIFLKMDDKNINNDTEIITYIMKSKGKEINTLIKREDKNIEIKIKPEKKSDGNYFIGTGIEMDYNLSGFSIVNGIKSGAKSFYYDATITVKTFVNLIIGKISISEISGPIGVVKAIGDSARQGIFTLLNFVAMISINLGVFNLLPIPALDGGRGILILIEIFTKKKLSDEKEGIINFVGFVTLIGLMLFVTSKDILKLF